VEEAWLAVVRGERRGPLARLARGLLMLASGPYAVAVGTRNRLFDVGWNPVRRAAVPVVSIGNLTLGGTGKTPCVEYVARFYRELGRRVVILSRGYGGRDARNDEALVLEDNLPDVPHLQGADRVALAATAVDELEAELLILDDGFQHRRLHRDWDVVLIDATRPPERDRLFPAGTLREPVGGLRRADAVLLTRCDQVPATEVEAIRGRLARRFPGLVLATTEHRPVELLGGPTGPTPTSEAKGRPVYGFCGIGNPAAFRRTLEDLGACVAGFRTFPDHHPYSRDDVTDLARWAATSPADALLLTTQKDWVKLRVAELGGRPLRAVRIGLHFRDGRHEFEAGLRRIAPPVPEPHPDDEEHGCDPST